MKSHVAELPRPRDFAPAVAPSCAPAAKLPPGTGTVHFDLAKRGESCSAKAALSDRAGFHMREVANPCKTLRISDRSTPNSYQLDFALARASDGALIICMDKSQSRHRHSGQFLLSDLARVSGIVLEFLRRNFSLFLLKCLLLQTGNPFRC